MSRLIDADALIKKCGDWYVEEGPEEGFIGTVQQLIAGFSTIEPERKKGKWIRTRTVEHDGELYCDQCGQEHPEQKLIWNYCPNCGADMRGEQE